MQQITKERIKEILTKAKNDKDLFNWCEEYKQFVNDCVHKCISSEVDYILKKSWEDREAPLSYEDLDFFDFDTTKEEILYAYDDRETEFKEYANDESTFNRRVKNKGDFEVFLNSLNDDELKELCDHFGIEPAEIEVYEWWVISDPLAYRLEKQGEIFLNGFWGRCTTGQSISLDYCVIKAFLSMLEDWAK